MTDTTSKTTARKPARTTRAKPKGESQPRSSAKTYERIQAAALWLFAMRGVDSSSIRDIGARAKVPTSLLYHYAPSKLQLLFELMVDGMNRHIAATKRALELGERPEARLIALVITHVMTHGKNRLMAKIMNKEWRALPKKQQAVILDLRDQVSQLWDDALEAGHAAGVFEFSEVKVTRMAIIEMCSGVSAWYQPSGPLGVEDLAAQFSDLALAMVRASRDGAPVRASDPALPSVEQVARLVAEAHIGAVKETR
jgi:AcrR family transcriptional regulator